MKNNFQDLMRVPSVKGFGPVGALSFIGLRRLGPLGLKPVQTGNAGTARGLGGG